MIQHGSIGLPPDSTGKKLHTTTLNSDLGVINHQVMSVGDPVNLNNIQQVDDYGSSYVRFQNGGMDFDTFGNSKVSQANPIGIYMHSIGKLEDLFTENVVGTASSQYVQLEKATKLITGTGGTDSINRTSDKRHIYTAGISNTTLFSCSLGDAGKAGVVRRWGYYDENDGLFFENNEGVFNVIQRSSVSGVVNEIRVAQSNFNGDKVDGTGLSKFNIDLTKANLFWIDYQWLGVGLTKFGIYSETGDKIVLHTFKNINNISTIYMKSGSLPVRYEQFNTDIPPSSSEMKVYNIAVYQNNALFKPKRHFQGSGLINKSIDSLAFKQIVSIRPSLLNVNGTRNNTVLLPSTINYSTPQPLVVMISKKATLENGATWSTPLGNNNPQSEMSIDGIINYGIEQNKGNILKTLLVDGTGSIDLSDIFDSTMECITLDANGLQSINCTIAVRPITYQSDFDMFMGLSWGEVHI